MVNKKAMEKDAEMSEPDSPYDSEVDENQKRVEKMANDIEKLYEQNKEYKMERDRKLAKKDKKQKQLIEQ